GRGPARVRAQVATRPPQMDWIEPAERLHAVRLQRLADRLEELPAVLLHQRLEKRHAEHLPLALVDARGEELVDVVAQRMALEERPPAVRLHEQLDGGLLLRPAAEDLC